MLITCDLRLKYFKKYYIAGLNYFMKKNNASEYIFLVYPKNYYYKVKYQSNNVL